MLVKLRGVENQVYSSEEVFGVIRTVMNDPMRKPLYTMLVEIIKLWFRDSVIPGHYYSSLLYRRDFCPNIYAYVGSAHFDRVYARINNSPWVELLNNKVLFDFFFRQTDIRLPKRLGFNVNNWFMVGDDALWISEARHMRTALETLIDSSSTASLFVKPIDGMHGKGCFAFDASDVSRLCEDKGLDLLNHGYLYQEEIVQHPKMGELHPSSVNTLRIDTYRTHSGDVSVISALTRMGANRSRVDNVSSGGCFVGVDLEQGTLMRRGFVLPEYGSAILDCHPDTGVVFEGFEIPMFHEAIAVAKRAAEMVPVGVVGWDIAIGSDGPILLEGNANYSYRVSQMAYGGYWRNPVFRRLIAEHAPEMNRIGRCFDKAYPGEVGQVADV